MGIKGLYQLLEKECPAALKEVNLKVYSNQIIACDASNVMYQFLVTTSNVHQAGGNRETPGFEMMDAQGNPTGHLLGLFTRTIHFLENRVKPLWVFDGEPPELKKEELKKRKELRGDAKDRAALALEVGDMDEAAKLKKRSIKLTKEMSAEAMKMLQLLGLPVVQAESEAEAMCVDLVKKKIASAVASEDMDCLTFGCSTQLRGFGNKKEPIIEINLEIVLKCLDISMDQFIDLCILCGCDYCKTIDGLGPTTALKMIKEFKTIERVLEEIKSKNQQSAAAGKKEKYSLPPKERFDFNAARKEFKKPKVSVPPTNLQYKDPDITNLKEFLVKEKQFSEIRLQSGLDKLEKAKKSGVQCTLESYFGKALPQIPKKGEKKKPVKTKPSTPLDLNINMKRKN